jgi:hypothetical protein
MSDLIADREEAAAARAQSIAAFWALAVDSVRERTDRALTPEAIRLREIRAQIAAVDARQRAAEAPYVAAEVEIEREIGRLKAKLAATYEARCAVAAPFECELDKLYEEENNG